MKNLLSKRIAAHPGRDTALWLPSGEVSYAELWQTVAAVAARLGELSGRALVFLLAQNDLATVVTYLACLDAGYPLGLLEGSRPETARPVVERYGPALLLAPEGPGGAEAVPEGYREAGFLTPLQLRVWQSAGEPPACHPELALLLTTSGSTGSPKLVRLSAANLAANAHSIAEYLELSAGSRGLQSLPLHYSYGLSLLNSHLAAGGAVALTQHSFLRPAFWADVEQSGSTSFSGVPYMYETLQRLRFDPGKYPALRTLTQAGGALRPDLIEHFEHKISAAGGRMFVMYGQTEATARIAYVPPERLREKLGSIGIAIPRGRLELVAPEDIAEDRELVYHGPNVMLGYAESPEDLQSGDTLGGRLATGDLGRCDADGFFYLTGRLKRIGKLFGKRVNLAEIEQQLEQRYPLRAAVIESQGMLRVFVAPVEGSAVDPAPVAAGLIQMLGIPARHVACEVLPEIPITGSGKKDYRALE